MSNGKCIQLDEKKRSHSVMYSRLCVVTDLFSVSIVLKLVNRGLTFRIEAFCLRKDGLA